MGFPAVASIVLNCYERAVWALALILDCFAELLTKLFFSCLPAPAPLLSPTRIGDYELRAYEPVLLLLRSIIFGCRLWAWATFLRPRGLLEFEVFVPERRKTF